MDLDAFIKKLFLQAALIFTGFIASGIYLVFFAKQEPAPAVPPPTTFWNGKAFVSEQGYIVNENYLPLRALARKPNVKLFRMQGIDKPWTWSP